MTKRVTAGRVAFWAGLVACLTAPGYSEAAAGARPEAPSAVVEIDGGVIDVSPDGTVLAAIAGEQGEQLCRMTLEGDVRACFDMPSPAVPRNVAWSPDGTRIAYDEVADSPPLSANSDIHVLDLESGDVTELGAADNSPDDGHDFRPVWADDDHIVFLRGPIDGREDERNLELVRSSLDGGSTVHPIELSLVELSPQSGVLHRGAYLVALDRDVGSQLWGINVQGELQLVAATSMPQLRVRAVSPSGDDLVIAQLNREEVEIGPMIVLDEAGRQSITDVPALRASFDPTGTSVAAVGLHEPDEPDSGFATIWNPKTGEAGASADLDVGAPLGIVWTPDDQLVVWADSTWQVLATPLDGRE